MQVRFFGAAGEVTGSCHLVEIGARHVLLDCGMVQGGREELKRNAARFDFDLKRIDAMVLSHAHIDHVGRLPLLARRGYHGPIYTHRATVELSRVMLEDAARLAAADIEHENRRRARRGMRALDPLYDDDDVRRVLRQLVPLPYGEEREILPGIRLRLSDAGHIIGAAIVELIGENDGRSEKLVFSGDIGPRGTPILRDPTPITSGDLVLLESTYGDRLHRSRGDTVAELGQIMHKAHASGGMVLIPAFAVGRTQELLYWFAQNYDEWDLGRWQIVLDSPMATKVIEVYDRHQDLFDEQAQKVWSGRRHPFRLPNLRMIVEQKESMALNDLRGGMIIIAGSGMCNGGRIVHHLRHHLWRDSTHVIIPGFQAERTLGRELVDRKPLVRIFGEPIKVRAEIHTVGGLSAHADQAGLMEWYGHIEGRPPVWLVHGEDKARTALAALLGERYGCKVGLAAPGVAAAI
jgi:metallo-beta-lactamase family protein